MPATKQPRGERDRPAHRAAAAATARGQQAERVPRVVLDAGVPDAEQVRREPGLQRMRAEGAERRRRRTSRCGERQGKAGGHFVYNLREDGATGDGLRIELQDTNMTIERRHVGKRLSEIVVFHARGQRAPRLPRRAGRRRPQGRHHRRRRSRCWRRSTACWSRSARDKSRLLSATIYLPDMADFAAMNAVWEAWVVPGQTPARATVEAGLAAPDYQVEIQVVATAPAVGADAPDLPGAADESARRRQCRRPRHRPRRRRRDATSSRRRRGALPVTRAISTS